MVQGISLNREILFVFGSTLWILTRGLALVIKKKKKLHIKLVRESTLVFLGMYLLGVACITLLPVNIVWNERVFVPASTYINYIPVASIAQSFYLLKSNTFSIDYELKLFLMNVGGNLFLLTPLSIMLLIIWDKCRKFKWCFVFCFLTSFLIETLQLIEDILGVAIGRICDIDDLILNSIGAVIGYLIYKLTYVKYGVVQRRGHTYHG